MRGSVRIGRIAGVPIRVHWSFSLLIVFALYVTSGQPRSVVLAYFAWIVALFASVIVHELSHCAVARRRGLTVRDIVVLPIGGVSEIEGLPGPPGTERDVAIAGPLASVGLAVLFGVLAIATGASIWPPALLAGSWLTRLAWLNLVLAAFNLLPALPMDGGRVLRAVLAGRRDEVSATRIAARVAQVLGVGMIAFFFVDPWLALIGVFVLMGATSERRAAGVRAAMRQFRIGDLMAQDQTAVPAAASVQDVGTWLSVFPGRAVPVTDAGACVGIVAIEDLLGAQPSSPVGTVCDRSAPVLHAEDPALGALQAFSASRRRQLAVTYLGLPVGVIYSATVEAVLRPAGFVTSST
jgi:Zn-dependent protease